MAYKNKEDQAAASKKHYEANKSKVKACARAFDKIARKRNRAYLAEHKAKYGCVDCGEKDPIVLDFDHVKGTKEKNLADAALNWSLDHIKKEIEKCQVRCANCHRRITHSRKQQNSLQE